MQQILKTLPWTIVPSWSILLLSELSHPYLKSPYPSLHRNTCICSTQLPLSLGGLHPIAYLTSTLPHLLLRLQVSGKILPPQCCLCDQHLCKFPLIFSSLKLLFFLSNCTRICKFFLLIFKSLMKSQTRLGHWTATMKRLVNLSSSVS